MDVSHQLPPVNFHSESSPLPSPGIELTVFGYVTGSIKGLYPLYHVSWRISVIEFLDIINLMSSATIFYQCSYCNFGVIIVAIWALVKKCNAGKKARRQEPHHQKFFVRSKTFIGWGLTPLQRYCRCSLQPQPTVLNRDWHKVLPLVLFDCALSYTINVQL